MKKRTFITHLHLKSKRNYKKRMFQNKVYCMGIAKKYDKRYWDGKRNFGYGGYRFIEEYWKLTAKKLVKTYKLTNNSKILDIGCGKGFLLYEIKKILPDILVKGLDISSYAVKNSKTEIKKNLKIFNCKKKLPYNKKTFDLVLSLGTIHNFNLIEIETVIKEIARVGKRAYIMVESYRNNEELFNLQCWALTCESFFSPIEWKHIFKSNNYKGDYEFIYFN